jgi:hypothetical protein
MKAIKSNPASTVLIITVGIAIVFLKYRIDWILYLSIGIGLLGFLSSAFSKFIEMVWFKLAALLSKIVPNILLSVIFYVFLFPLAVLSRVFGAKNNLLLKKPKAGTWKTPDRNFDSGYFERMW